MTQEAALRVKKRDNQVIPFSPERVTRAIYKAARSTGVDDMALASQLSRQVMEAVEKNSKKIPSVEEIQDMVEQVLIQNGHTQIAKSYILYRRKHEELRKVKQDMLGGLLDDSKLSMEGLLLAKERYLLKDKDGVVVETPKEMFRRVAKSIASVEASYSTPKEAIQELEEKFYDAISRFEFIPSGRIMAGAGTKHSQLYSSFVLPIPDSMKGIFATLYDKALVQRLGGGTGFSFSRLRPKDTRIVESAGVATGPVGFMHLFDHASKLTRQGGNRTGANMGSLSVEHPDIMEFITCKDGGGLSNFNISVEVTDKFMEAVRKNKEFELKDPATGKAMKKVHARQVFDLMVFSAWKLGDPGILFIDRINRYNPLVKMGVIETTDPCGDQPLQPYDASNLGAINLAKFVEQKDIAWERLGKMVQLSVRFLDNVVDASKFASEQIEKTVRGNRRIGLGILGFADLLYRLEIPYDSDRAVAVAQKMMKFIYETARETSKSLAKEKGAFPNWSKSRYHPKTKIRNASLITIAPAGARSVFAETSSGIEPHFALGYVRKLMGQFDFLYVNKILEEKLAALGLRNDELMRRIIQQGMLSSLPDIPDEVKRTFVTAQEISPKWHIAIQAAFQKYVDNAISKTINFPKEATIKDIAEAYLLAYKKGCKGITVYRDGSRADQIITIGRK